MPGVFIVRPETEVLAGLAIDEARSVVGSRGEARVVDLCTGSGAIALAVATEAARTEVWAVEKDRILSPWPAITATVSARAACTWNAATQRTQRPSTS